MLPFISDSMWTYVWTGLEIGDHILTFTNCSRNLEDDVNICYLIRKDLQRQQGLSVKKWKVGRQEVLELRGRKWSEYENGGEIIEGKGSGMPGGA